MNFTNHAIQRMQQRGFKSAHIELIMQLGKRQKIGNAIRFTMTKKITRRLLDQGGSVCLLEKCQSSFVVAQGQLIITVAHII